MPSERCNRANASEAMHPNIEGTIIAANIHCRNATIMAISMSWPVIGATMTSIVRRSVRRVGPA